MANTFIDLPNDGEIRIDGYVQTNPAVLTALVNTTVAGGLAQDESYAVGQTVPLLVDQQGHLQVDINDSVAVNMTYADDAQLDAFQRLRVAEPQTLFDSKQLVDNQPLYWDDQQTTGSGTSSTYNTNQASSTLAVSNTTAGTRVRQTFQRFNYQPGKSLFIAMTGIFGTGHAGITKRIGYFDGYNGVFFQQSGTTLSVVVRSNTSGAPVDTVITQANWNTDTLDGSGDANNPSGILLDPTKPQIFIIDLQWLGVGRIRFGFAINGDTQHCNIINNANITPLVYMSLPNLPLRCEISNDGTGNANSIVQICGTVISEGGRQDNGQVFSADDGYTGLTTNSDSKIYPLVCIRLKSNYQMASIEPLALNVMETTGVGYRIVLLLNPTVVGTALSFSDITNSAMQMAAPTNNTTVTGGTQMFSAYGFGGNISIPTNGILPSDLRVGSNIAGVSDILMLCGQRLTTTTCQFYGSLTWREKI